MLQAKVIWEKFGRYAHVLVGLVCALWLSTTTTEQREELAFFGMIAVGVVFVQVLADFSDMVSETKGKSLADSVAQSFYRFSLQISGLLAVFTFGGQLYLLQTKDLTASPIGGLPAWVDTTTLIHSFTALICAFVVYRLYEIVFVYSWEEEQEDGEAVEVVA